MKPKLVIFDVNHTLIEDNSWAQLNVAFGMTQQEDQLLLDLNQQGILPNEMWVKIVNNLYLKRGKANIKTAREAVLNYKWIDGAQEVVKTLKDSGYRVALISGGVDLAVLDIAEKLGIELVGYGSKLIFDDNGELLEMTYEDEDQIMKERLLDKFVDQLGIKQSEVICVADGDNDASMFVKTGRGITFKGSKIEHLAWKIVGSIKDVPEIIKSV